MGAPVKAALAYAERLRWPVFPCRGKIPLTEHGVKQAQLNLDVIRNWWARWPSANIAIAAGERAGFWVLDVDGEEGNDTLADLQREHGDLPLTPRQFTPGGGQHILFQHVPGIRNRVRVLPGIDTRSDGGYIIAAPSVSADNGRAWVWSVDHHPREVPLATAPDWLVKLVSEPPRSAGRPWLEPALGTVAEGRRNATAASVIGHLLRCEVNPHLARQLTEAWNRTHCDPPLPDDELAKVIDSIAMAEYRRRSAGGEVAARIEGAAA